MIVMVVVVVAFSSCARILGECLTIHYLPALLFLFFVLVFIVEISSRTLIPLFRPGSVHSGSASSDYCDQMFPGELRTCELVSLIDSHPMPGQRHSRPTPTSLGQGCMRVRCNLPSAVLAKLSLLVCALSPVNPLLAE